MKRHPIGDLFGKVVAFHGTGERRTAGYRRGRVISTQGKRTLRGVTVLLADGSKIRVTAAELLGVNEEGRRFTTATGVLWFGKIRRLEDWLVDGAVRPPRIDLALEVA